MEEVLNKIKELIQNNENEKAIKYIENILKNKNADAYMDTLIDNLR